MKNTKTKSPKPKKPQVERVIKRRKKFTQSQLAVLEKNFEKSANWTRAEMVETAQALKLPVNKIYKWNWDRKKRNARSDL